MPRAKISAAQIEDLAFIGSTLSEMAIFLDCDEASLDGRFRNTIKRGMARRMIFLRRELFVRAVNGDAKVLKWFWQNCLSETNEQLRDFERRQKEFYESLGAEEIVDMAESVKRYLDHLSLVDKTEIPVEPRTDPASPVSNLTN